MSTPRMTWTSCSVCHKEHDYVWIVKHKLYQKTFENKHFHVYRNCLVGRDPGFDFTHV